MTPDEPQRTETDSLGDRQLPADALWGIHTARAIENFALTQRPVRGALVRAYGMVKQACVMTNREIGALPMRIAAPLELACAEMAAGHLDGYVMVDALQGGAGTSTNMNVNEVLANRALQLLGESPGCYSVISPHDHVNLHQSTNDTYPTALRLASLRSLQDLEVALVALLEGLQTKEREFADVVKVGRTEYQDAALVTLGREFGAYAEAIGRDRWRIFKCMERLRVVNLGGTAVGTGLGAPRQFIFRAVDHLRELSGLGVARAENLLEATQNCDAFAEVSGMLRTLATNLIKIANDLRLLSSGPDAGLGEIKLPPLQAGSSIMPGKVNPVIPEAVIQAALQVMGADQVIATACSMGTLELNPFLPLIAENLLSSLSLLSNAVTALNLRCIVGVVANRERCALHTRGATAQLTALVGRIGYDRAVHLACLADTTGTSVHDLVLTHTQLSEEDFERLISPAAVNQLGTNQ